jgi:SAM-dependent methyltransferase
LGLLHYLNKKDAQDIHGEIVVDNYTLRDPDIDFFALIRSLYLRHNIKSVLDYGSGRNYYTQDFNPELHSYYIRELRDLRYGEAHVTAVDVSPAVLTHPTSDTQINITPGENLPFSDAQFDLIVSDFVFEHLEDPAKVTAELLRVLKPGGWVLARTPNKYGYVAIIAALVPNRLHQLVLKTIQPYRKELDVFPVYYRINTNAQVRQYFPNCETTIIDDNWEPQYFFGKKWLYRINNFINYIIPSKLGVTSIFIVRKPL